MSAAAVRPVPETDFDAVVRTVEQSYAGYCDKVHGREEGLSRLTVRVREALAVAAADADADAERGLLGEWLAFFGDRHLCLLDTKQASRVEAKLSGSSHEPELSRMDETAALLTIPSFGIAQLEAIERLLAVEGQAIESRPILIVDLRGNGGGSDSSYSPLLPLLYTDPMRSVGCDFLASEENAAFYRGLLHDASLPRGIREWLVDLVAEMEQSPASFVAGGPDQEIRFESALPCPGRVGVLIDGVCASATEEFLLLARQSSKVTLFGSRTQGCLDYSNLRPVTLPSGRSVLHVPTSRSRRLPGAPIDVTGIVPDVPVPVDAADPVAFVLEHLRSSRGYWVHADPRTIAGRERERKP